MFLEAEMGATTRGGKAPDGEVAVVRAAGDVDRACLESCDWLLGQAGDVRHAVVDLSDATAIDYRAAPLLVPRRRVLRARGGELAVAAGSRQVRDVIRASTGAELQVFSTVAEAVTWLKGGAAGVAAGPAARSRRAPPVRR